MKTTLQLLFLILLTTLTGCQNDDFSVEGFRCHFRLGPYEDVPTCNYLFKEEHNNAKKCPRCGEFMSAISNHIESSYKRMKAAGHSEAQIDYYLR